MCGIAGYFGTGEIPEERIADCLARMRRRGPDNVGTYRHEGPSGGHVVLLHSRLSIIDLDRRANQPMRLGDKVIVCNGELYNYLECRKALGDDRRCFRTESDTEVLLNVLDANGLAGLDECEGMWAFALYREADSSLVLCRDRFGEKPLYVFEDETGLYFGSEIKFIAALGGRWPPLNLRQLYRYLVNGYKSLYKTQESFYEGVSAVAPGTALCLDSYGGRAVHRYWTPVLDIQDESLSYEDAVEGARDALIESVKLRLRADVPIAFCLSGGVDSNALIGIAKRVLGYDVRGFTIMNTDRRYEEREMVERSVRELALKHTSIPVDTRSFLPRLRELVNQHDAPVYTITYFAHWLLMKSVAEHGYRIAISGTAADELFSGYYDHHNAYLYEMRNQPEAWAEAVGNWRRHIAPIVRNPYLKVPDMFAKDPTERGYIYLNADTFAGYLKTDWREPFAEEAYSRDLLRNRMANELFHESVPVILHEDDLNAMYYSIENRSPYLDRPLYEFCQRIPTRHLIREGRAKAVLRDAVRGMAPDAVLDNHRKVGFNAPLFSYLDVKDPEVRAQILDDGPVFDHVRKASIEALVLKPELENSASKFLFNFINAKIFLEEMAAA